MLHLYDNTVSAGCGDFVPHSRTIKMLALFIGVKNAATCSDGVRYCQRYVSEGIRGKTYKG